MISCSYSALQLIFLLIYERGEIKILGYNVHSNLVLSIHIDNVTQTCSQQYEHLLPPDKGRAISLKQTGSGNQRITRLERRKS